MRKSKRIEAILSCIKPSRTFAEIGCDHGFITYYALENGLVDFAYLSDISEKSLSKARRLFANKFADKVRFNVGDGFENLPCDIDEVAICGMGGTEICSIISSAKSRPECLLLSPQKNSESVRQCVLSLGYGIDNDFMVCDGDKFYSVISCVYGLKTEPYNGDELLYGRDSLLNKGDFVKYLTKQIEKLSGFQHSDEACKKIERFKVLKNEIERIL
ncbi:MAG: tRNA (adenine(22)-N(1))-methyltransferase [Christensenellaceae bacterium]